VKICHLWVGKDPRLVINMDETQLAAKKRFDLLCEACALALDMAQAKMPHLTGVCAFGASGRMCKAILILKNLKSLEVLADLQEFVDFGTSAPGSMNKGNFLYFTLQISHDISQYRMALPPGLRTQAILPLLDGHTSRLLWRARRFLNFHTIQVVTFSCHC
jgi:hypothetical protein